MGYHLYVFTERALKTTRFTVPNDLMNGIVDEPTVINFKPSIVDVEGYENLFKYEIDIFRGIGEKIYFQSEENEWLDEHLSHSLFMKDTTKSMVYFSYKWLDAFYLYKAKSEIVLGIFCWINFISKHIYELTKIGFWIHYNTEVYYMEEQHFTNVKSHTLSFENITPNDLLGIEEDDILFITLDK